MMDAADRLGEKDPRVRAALALRGINYATITVSAAGMDALGLQRLGNGDAKSRLAGRSGTDDGHDLTGFGLAFSGGRHRFAPLPDSDRR